MHQGNIEAVAAINKKGMIAKKCMIDRVIGSFYSGNESHFVKGTHAENSQNKYLS